MLKRDDKVYTQIVKNCSMSELMPIIKGKAEKDAVIYTDGFKNSVNLDTILEIKIFI